MLSYEINAESKAHERAKFEVNGNSHDFGIAKGSTEASPMDLLLGSFAACILKNVERFSEILKFEYEEASVHVKGLRIDKPPALHSIEFVLSIKSSDLNLNRDLLLKNIQKFGTIYNTVARSAKVTGKIELI